MESKSSTSNLPEELNAEDQNEQPIASLNKLRDEVLCLKARISELRVDKL